LRLAALESGQFDEHLPREVFRMLSEPVSLELSALVKELAAKGTFDRSICINIIKKGSGNLSGDVADLVNLVDDQVCSSGMMSW
jgi:hypothetical protein